MRSGERAGRLVVEVDRRDSVEGVGNDRPSQAGARAVGGHHSTALLTKGTQAHIA